MNIIGVQVNPLGLDPPPRIQGIFFTGDNLNHRGGKKKFRLRRDVLLPWDLLESNAFLELKGAKSIRVLIRFYQKRRWAKVRRRIEYISESMAFTYSEAQELGIGPSRFHEIIPELHRLGFIDIEHQGGGLMKDYSRYSISNRWRKYGTPDFEHKEKPRSVRPGRDIRTLKQRKTQAAGTDLVTVERHSQSLNGVTVGEEETVSRFRRFVTEDSDSQTSQSPLMTGFDGTDKARC